MYKKVVHILFVSEYVSNLLCNFLFIIVSQFVSAIFQLPAIPWKLPFFSLLPVVSNVLYKLLLFYNLFFSLLKRS